MPATAAIAIRQRIAREIPDAAGLGVGPAVIGELLIDSLGLLSR
jgi:hypothetical protein